MDFVNNAFGHDFGDGWSDTAVYPFKTSNSAPGTAAEFCATQTGTQGGVTRASICNTCLATKGWYFDGFILGSSGTYSGQYPSIWYTGNYLNFFPPKFLSARKIVKDVIANQIKVRMALAKTVDAGATVFQDFNPSCGMPEGSSFQNNRSTYAKALNDSIQFTGSTRPLSKALLDLGDHYHSPTLPWFTANGAGNYNANQASICSVCQVSTVIVISGGVPTFDEGSTTLPTGTTTADDVAAGTYAGTSTTGITGIGAGTGTNLACTKDCAAFSGGEDYLNNLPRVAWYLQNMDLRENSEKPLDCTLMGGVQRIQTYTVGFGIAQNPKAGQVLQHTAAAGGGIAVAAEDPAMLKERLNQLLQEISTRSTSFSVATISTLQTTAGRAVIIPRFDPNKTAHWEGHLLRFDLYSEFVNGCTPGGAGDLDCDGVCASVFLQDQPTTGSDANRSLIGEDGTGAFVRNDPPDKALCTQAPACTSSTSTTACSKSGSAPAVPFWDAGAKLAARSWKSRSIYTVTDDSGPAGVQDGRIDGYDTTFPLIDTATGTVIAAAAQKIVPYLGLGTSSTGGSTCAEVSNLLNQAGDTVNAATVAASPLECAKAIIRYVAGADVFNELGNPAPAYPQGNQDDLGDRNFKLGDIFHSSPQVVSPPLPREGILCNLGLSVQCLPSLWATPTDSGAAGYDGFSLSARYYNRDKFILVGANDGLLHAFHAGTWQAGKDDLYTSAVKESEAPFNGYFDRGTAEELWAFLPPDLISKLPLLMKTVHQYYVDGTAMVRDVWADGSSNQMAAATAPDDVKQAQEFHTVAVVGERRGGTRFFALDVTNADGVTSAQVGGVTFDRKPKLLWIYPQPGDPESLTFGETYDDFLPSPPPIAPVRLGVSAAGADALHAKTPSVNVPGALAATTTSTPYHERWVVFLNGGFDPQYVRGRGVHMVDVWAGNELFDFSYPNQTDASVDTGDPRRNLRFPVPGTIGMSAWGRDAVRRESAPSHDFFFDTATFSDAGGQLWALRFFTPGQLGADGRVENWFGARVFQMGLVGDCKLCSGQPIFVITGDASIAPPGESITSTAPSSAPEIASTCSICTAARAVPTTSGPASCAAAR